MSNGIIYKITNTINGKCYIGQTTSNINKRWSQHIYNAKTQSQKCRFLENAIKKYGKENLPLSGRNRN